MESGGSCSGTQGLPAIARIVIIGGGFAGLNAAMELAGVRADVTLIDRRNFHLFQPLLYQVATAGLSPADIASPIRHVLRHQRNCHVVLAEPSAINLAESRVVFDDGTVLEYDWLVLAAGATHSYFGHNDWEQIAPGLKTIEDATEIRRRILLSFESAEYEGSPDARRAALTFAIVGGGPTGVELAGAIMEIAAKTIPRDFRFIDTKTTRVILFDAGDRLLPAFSPEMSARARRDLERMGVEVRLNSQVTNVTNDGVHVGGEFVPARSVFWAAGVRANPIGASLGVAMEKTGQIKVGPDLTVPGYPRVFVVGDMASVLSAGKRVPGVAPAAIQMGRYVGSIIKREVNDARGPGARRPFVYRDKGSLATIGKARAVAEIAGFKFAGFLAWAVWSLVHIMFLISFRNRFVVMFNWAWGWFFLSKSARLITGDSSIRLDEVRESETVIGRKAARRTAKDTSSG
ncbi:MAG: NAD(P)/FAD-dependent oxidoreductase [Phycisphaerales bacterium]|nr:NAD(P)/FAD-dependent oxidoreductase [Planctomycetota bacterium]